MKIYSFSYQAKLGDTVFSALYYKQFTDSLNPDEARQNVGPHLDPKLFDTWMVFLKEFIEKS